MESVENAAVGSNGRTAEHKLSLGVVRQQVAASVDPLGIVAPVVHAQIAWWLHPLEFAERWSQFSADAWALACNGFSRAAGARVQDVVRPQADDTRFADPVWSQNPSWAALKQWYLLTTRHAQDMLYATPGLSGTERRRAAFWWRQWLNAVAPTNFFALNPVAQRAAVASQGQTLRSGWQNFLDDLRAGDIRMADPADFKVGRNLATTPGEVVARTRLMELIQYTPTTPTVHKTPLIIFPPWINKFYILDLKPQNSLIRWIVDQGFTLFVVSWKNPDRSYADVGMEDYIRDGYLTAIDEVKAITGEKQVNAVGYCIAGTTLSLVLALLEKRKDKSIKTATFFTTLTDFSDQGEFTPFLQDDFVDGIERQVRMDGVLSSYYMTRTFSYLRANDLIYQPAIRSYMMGESPPAFDLLYWNGDSTNLPGKMAMEYLRGLCQADAFTTDGFDLMGEVLHVSGVKVPLCAIACETDHIAPWVASFNGVAQMGSSDKTFILSESGHIAGIVNPPTKEKYGHYTSEAPIEDAEEWRAAATYTKGSWWPRWGAWLSGHSGKMVAAREPGDARHPPLAPAPGTYVAEVVVL